MIFTLAQRMLREPDKRILAKALFHAAWHGRRSMAAYRRRAARGLRSPACLFISVTDRCNLRCQGCWVSASQPPREWALDDLDTAITDFKRETQARFFGLLGGEPLLYPHLMDILARHPDVYFQVLTNGVLLDDAVAAEFRRLGHVTPLISIEGNPAVSDERRGGHGVLQAGLDALEACRRQRLLFGVASSLCRSNIGDLLSEAFVRDMVARGAHYLWYYIYRPVGPDPHPDLALTGDDILQARRFLVAARHRFPILILDAYWDAEGRAVCPAAEGISHHLGPGGDLEPCPPIQFSREHAGNGRRLPDLFQDSDFLEGFRRTAARQGRGCILLEHPEVLAAFVGDSRARDTSGRGTGLAELRAMRPRAGHAMPGREIPETHWLYRWAKKRWFYGFGAYG